MLVRHGSMDVTRAQVLRFRAAQQRLGVAGAVDDDPILDLGAQDTGGPAAARWALTLRGREVEDEALVYLWTLRGAPHAYRRAQVAEVVAAVSPYEESDAAKRVFDAAKPLREADIAVLEALRVIAGHLREIVVRPTVKGEVSSALTSRLPPPYLRHCRPCDAIHTYEQPFRLATTLAGLELEPATSPPVLRPIAGWAGPAAAPPAELDPIRAVLHHLGPVTAQQVAGYLDAPVRTVRRRWPDDAVEVTVDGEERGVLAADVPLLEAAVPVEGVRLLGAFDPWLQVRDRSLLVADEARRKELWRVLGRPGAVLVGTEVVGTWRPRSQGERLQLRVEIWDGGPLPDGIAEQAERLAAHRGQAFAGFADA
jgi:hypothetical protein